MATEDAVAYAFCAMGFPTSCEKNVADSTPKPAKNNAKFDQKASKIDLKSVPDASWRLPGPQSPPRAKKAQGCTRQKCLPESPREAPGAIQEPPGSAPRLPRNPRGEPKSLPGGSRSAPRRPKIDSRAQAIQKHASDTFFHCFFTKTRNKIEVQIECKSDAKRLRKRYQ